MLNIYLTFKVLFRRFKTLYPIFCMVIPFLIESKKSFIHAAREAVFFTCMVFFLCVLYL